MAELPHAFKPLTDDDVCVLIHKVMRDDFRGWLVGRVMKAAHGKASPDLVKICVDRYIGDLKVMRDIWRGLGSI